MSDRMTYGEIRIYIFECYFEYCRMKSSCQHKWKEGELEIGYAYDQYSASFNNVVEKLMLEVIVLILIAGRHEDSIEFHMQKIKEILMENNLSYILSGLPADECEDFLIDLKILSIVEK